MLDLNAVDTDDQEEDFLAKADEDGAVIEPAACPLNPDGLEGCEACQ